MKSKKEKPEYADLTHIMSPRSVAVIGASDNPAKVGHAIMQNYIDVGFPGKVYPINISADKKIMGYRAYKNILEVKEPIDLAVICIPAEFVSKTIEECGKAHVNGIVVVSSGFSEVGNVKLQEELVASAKKYGLPVVGPNCLGVMDSRARNDTLFLPTYKIDRPKIGGISFASQSGAVGSTVLDLISGESFGLSKFISYGNAAVVDEVDILNYLGNDEQTKVIVYYLEGVTRGREFIEVAKRVTKKKPVVIIKGGITEAGALAAHSHTAALAGSYEAYEAVFRQYGFSVATDLDELLYFAKVFDTQPLPKGDRIAVLTNGGGHGVLATDAIYQNGLKVAELSKESQEQLRKVMPSFVNIRMPFDMSGEATADSYAKALEIMSHDTNIDAFMVIALFQTPGADERLVQVLSSFSTTQKKPIVVVSSGATYTKSHVAMLENAGVPVYESPTSAARSLLMLVNYSKYRAMVEK